MKQEINLYQPILRPQRKPFSAATLAMLILFFLVVFAGIYLFSLQNLSVIEAKMAMMDREVRELRGQVEALALKFPKQAESKLLQTEIARLERLLDKRKAVGRALEKHALENERVFSELLESLARQHVEGTWLTRVSIDDGGRSLGFEGKTWSSALVPAYIRRLSGETPLRGLAFNVLEMQRDEKTGSNLKFQVRTRPGAR